MNRRVFSITSVSLALASASVSSAALADEVRNVVVVHVRLPMVPAGVASPTF